MQTSQRKSMRPDVSDGQMEYNTNSLEFFLLIKIKMPET